MRNVTRIDKRILSYMLKNHLCKIFSFSINSAQRAIPVTLTNKSDKLILTKRLEFVPAVQNWIKWDKTDSQFVLFSRFEDDTAVLNVAFCIPQRSQYLLSFYSGKKYSVCHRSVFGEDAARN